MNPTLTREQELAKLQADPNFAGGTFYGRTPGGIVDLSNQQVAQPAPQPTPVQPTAPVTPQQQATAPLQQPMAAPAPAAPAAPQTPAKAYTVQAGDSLAKIATKFGVPITEISGYRSGDPNKIYPGETLTIGKQPAPTAPTTPTGGQPPTDGFSMDGMTPEANILSEYKIDPKLLQFGFQTNPTKTIKDLVSEIMQVTGLPDAKAQIEEISSNIEVLENERDREIDEINDNPFISAGTKRARIEKIQDKYEKRIANRVNRLQLIQGAYDDARQEAQFVATTAINLYDKNRDFEQGRLEFLMEQAEKQVAAKSKLNPGFELSPGQSRFEYNDETGQYEQIASVAPRPTSRSKSGSGSGSGTAGGGYTPQEERKLRAAGINPADTASADAFLYQNTLVNAKLSVEDLRKVANGLIGLVGKEKGKQFKTLDEAKSAITQGGTIEVNGKKVQLTKLQKETIVAQMEAEAQKNKPLFRKLFTFGN